MTKRLDSIHQAGRTILGRITAQTNDQIEALLRETAFNKRKEEKQTECRNKTPEGGNRYRHSGISIHPPYRTSQWQTEYGEYADTARAIALLESPCYR